MKICLGSDHAGYHLKRFVYDYLVKKGYDVTDLGCHSDKRTEYPRWIRPTAEAVARGEYDRGFVFGGSGNGEAIVANRVPGIRCALCWDHHSAYLGRLHNDANVIAMGERMVTQEYVTGIVDIFLTQEFEGGRHIDRIKHIDHPPEVWPEDT